QEFHRAEVKRRERSVTLRSCPCSTAEHADGAETKSLTTKHTKTRRTRNRGVRPPAKRAARRKERRKHKRCGVPVVCVCDALFVSSSGRRCRPQVARPDLCVLCGLCVQIVVFFVSS